MRSSSVRRRRPIVADADSALVAAAASGDGDAFGELYRRHAPAAWGVAQSVVRNPEDAADAVADAFARVFRALPAASAQSQCLPFRAYLLRSARHAAIDIVRRSSRVKVTDDIGEEPDRGDRSRALAPNGPVDDVLAGEDRSLVAHAFAQLPTRWRTALWLIEVERMSTREVGMVLGVGPNNAAQLAARARSRLREHYLQAHVRTGENTGCREHVGALGGYLAGTVTRRQRSRVDDHLSCCADCRDRVAQVEDLGMTLRGLLLPLPLMVGDRARRAWTSGLRHDLAPLLGASPGPQSLVDAGLAQSTSALTQPAANVATLLQRLAGTSPVLERLVVGTSAGVLVLGASAMVMSDMGSVPREAPQTAAGPLSLRTDAGGGEGGRGTGISASPASFDGPGPLDVAARPQSESTTAPASVRSAEPSDIDGPTRSAPASASMSPVIQAYVSTRAVTAGAGLEVGVPAVGGGDIPSRYSAFPASVILDAGRSQTDRSQTQPARVDLVPPGPQKPTASPPPPATLTPAPASTVAAPTLVATPTIPDPTTPLSGVVGTAGAAGGPSLPAADLPTVGPPSPVPPAPAPLPGVVAVLTTVSASPVPAPLSTATGPASSAPPTTAPTPPAPLSTLPNLPSSLAVPVVVVPTLAVPSTPSVLPTSTTLVAAVAPLASPVVPDPPVAAPLVTPGSAVGSVIDALPAAVPAAVATSPLPAALPGVVAVPAAIATSPLPAVLSAATGGAVPSLPVTTVTTPTTVPVPLSTVPTLPPSSPVPAVVSALPTPAAPSTMPATTALVAAVAPVAGPLVADPPAAGLLIAPVPAVIASVVGAAPAEGGGPPTTSTSASTVTVAPADLAPSPLVGPPIPATPLLNSNGTGPGA